MRGLPVRKNPADRELKVRGHDVKIRSIFCFSLIFTIVIFSAHPIKRINVILKLKVNVPHIQWNSMQTVLLSEFVGSKLCYPHIYSLVCEVGFCF